MLKLFARIGHRFLREDRGGLIVEAVIILPALIWGYVALFVYWDAYRYENTATKATYTISDMISREVTDVNDPYISGLKTVFDYLIDANQETKVVVTSVTWSKVRNKYEVLWSEARGTGAIALGTASLQAFKNQLPVMADGDSVIVVQTSVHYVPPLEVGVPTFDYGGFVVTRPRRTPKITCPSCGVGT
jgi:Flp pilus assembly protein TadG